MKCLPEHMMRNRHPMKNLADCFRLAQQETLEIPKWAPSPGLSMSWTSFASSPEASNQNLPVQPGPVWYPEEQVSGNAVSPQNHCFDLFYGVGVSDRKALSAPAHFSAEPSTVSATSKSHQLSLLFPDIEPSIIDTVLKLLVEVSTQQLNGCQVMPILIPTRLIHHRMMCRERKI